MSWESYFDACSRNDVWAAFEALANVGVLPVVNGPDAKGKIKRPLAYAWQKVTTEEWAEKLKRRLQSGEPVGIGAKPVGYLVMDVDPEGKDRRNLATAWREASQLVFGADDPPKTLTVATEAGCHVWFKAPAGLIERWSGTGKKVINLKSGGKLELYAGISDGGFQVACAPSEGKTIGIGVAPIDLPNAAAEQIMMLTVDPPKPPPERTRQPIAAVDTDFEWIRDCMAQGWLDSEIDDYDSWLHVGMALYDKFGHAGAGLWESWSSRHYKHVDDECYTKIRSFKRISGKVFRFGSLVSIVQRNGGPKPPKAVDPVPDQEAQSLEISPDLEPADIDTILALMQEREWVWGDKETNVGWIVQRGLHLLEGKEGTGKTRFLADLCRRWSLDLRWPDGSPIAMPIDSKLLFVASDSHYDQIAMTSQSFGIPSKNIIFTGPKQDPYNFTSLDDPVTLELIRTWCTRYKVGIVAIDTLMAASARPLVDPQEVAKIAVPLRQIARECNVAVVLVGHLNSQGETWGRAIGRQCDNVIRMEAAEHDEQEITIRSVKARWNRFALPTITGRQGESGWDYSAVLSEAKDTKAMGARERASAKILELLGSFGRTAWSDLTAELIENGYGKTTVRRAIDFMVKDGTLIEFKETFPSGKSCTFYDITPHRDVVP